jgi:hypothetical protein
MAAAGSIDLESASAAAVSRTAVSGPTPPACCSSIAATSARAAMLTRLASRGESGSLSSQIPSRMAAFDRI